MTNPLGNPLAEAGQGSGRETRVALQELVRRPLEAHERWGIDAVRQIPANGPDRSLVTDSEAHGMDAVVEILRITLMEAERKMAEAAINISHVVEEHALDVVPNQGKSQFYIIEEQRIPAQRESSRLIGLTARSRWCADIARTRLIVRKRS